MTNSKTIIILGNPRGGTSLTAALVKILGINIGQDVNATEQNPTGDMEDSDFSAIIQNIMNEGGIGKTPNSYDIHHTDNLIEKYKGDIQTLLQKKSANSPVFGWKHPFTTILINHFINEVENPYFVCAHRDRVATANSSSKLGNISFEDALVRADSFEKAMGQIAASYPDIPTIHINFEDILENPEKELRSLGAFLEVPVTESQITKAKEKTIPRSKITKAKRKAFLKRVLRKIKKYFK
jgi:hypothetical protein